VSCQELPSWRLAVERIERFDPNAVSQHADSTPSVARIRSVISTDARMTPGRINPLEGSPVGVCGVSRQRTPRSVWRVQCQLEGWRSKSRIAINQQPPFTRLYSFPRRDSFGISVTSKPSPSQSPRLLGDACRQASVRLRTGLFRITQCMCPNARTWMACDDAFHARPPSNSRNAVCAVLAHVVGQP
jgi:hypothetical protein